jgi:DNA-nicking Smr family endonuclease
MRPPRRLTPEEAAMWRKVAESVTPLQRRRKPPVVAPPPPAPRLPEAAPPPQPARIDLAAALAAAEARSRAGVRQPAPAPRRSAPRVAEEKVGLDASWERKIARGGLEPDFSLDLHGSTLDQAYSRLMHGLSQARAMGARVVLIVTGKPRPVEAADRSGARGAIRAKIADWLAASDHASDIAAVRGAHRRHGGQGALYVVLKRRR